LRSGPNWIDFPILIKPPAAASYRTRLRWRTRTGGSAEMSICCLASRKLDGPSCVDCGWKTRMRASSTVRTESSCECDNLEISHYWQDIHAGRKETRTWMSRWSDRQFSETGSGWFGAPTAERNFPPNIRVVGDSTKLAYSCPCIFINAKLSTERWNNWRTIKL
jgi:hypothetical protein